MQTAVCASLDDFRRWMHVKARLHGYAGPLRWSDLVAPLPCAAATITWEDGLGIVRNACHDHHRSNSTLTRLKGHLAVLAGMAALPDGRDLFRRSWLASELARLSPLLRETVVLVVGEGMTHAEAAMALGVTESTVSGRMHEVRRQAGLAKDIGDEH